MKDIQTRQDIELLVNSFYKKLLADESIRYLFLEVAQLEMKTHLPIMHDFWEFTLLGTGTYSRNPMQKHIELNRKAELTDLHFDTWLRYWEETVHELFSGPKAVETIQRANHIAQLMKYQIRQ